MAARTPRSTKADETKAPADPAADTAPLTPPADDTAPLEPPAAPSAAPLEAPAPRKAPEPDAITTPASVSVVGPDVSGSLVTGERIVDGDTGEPITDPEGVFEDIVEGGTLVRATRRLHHDVVVGINGKTITTLLVAKGTQLPRTRADRILAVVRGTD